MDNKSNSSRFRGNAKSINRVSKQTFKKEKVLLEGAGRGLEVYSPQVHEKIARDVFSKVFNLDC